MAEGEGDTIAADAWARMRGRLQPLDMTVAGSLQEARESGWDRVEAYAQLRQRIRDDAEEFRRVRDNLFRTREYRRDLEDDQEHRGLSATEAGRLEEAEAREADLEEQLSRLYNRIGESLDEAHEREDALSSDILVMETERLNAILSTDGRAEDPRKGWEPEPDRSETFDPAEHRPGAA